MMQFVAVAAVGATNQMYTNYARLVLKKADLEGLSVIDSAMLRAL